MGAPASPSQGPPRLCCRPFAGTTSGSRRLTLSKRNPATMEVGQDEAIRSQRSFLAALSQARQAKSQMANRRLTRPTAEVDHRA
jgi:hypothetical protein